MYTPENGKDSHRVSVYDLKYTNCLSAGYEFGPVLSIFLSFSFSSDIFAKSRRKSET